MRLTIKMESLIIPLLIILGISQYIGSNLLSIGITFIIISVATCLPIRVLLIVMYMCLPFFNLMNQQVGITSMYYLLVGFFTLRYLFLKEPKYKLREKIFLLIFLFLIRLWDMGPQFVSWYLLLLPLVLSYKEDFFIESLPRIISASSASMIISCFFGYFMRIHKVSIYDHGYVWNKGTVTTRFAGLIGDSVVLGLLLALLIALNLVIFANTPDKKMPVLYVTILSAFGLLTYSRMFIIAELFCIIVFFIYFRTRKHIIKFALAAVILATSVYAISYSNNLLISNFALRFSEKDITNGRLSTIEHYLNLIKQNPVSLLIGMRFDEYTAPFIPAGKTAPIRYAHNIYLETIFVIGLFFTLCFLIAGVYKLNRYLQQNGMTIALLPLFVLILYGFVLHGHYEFPYYANVAVVFGVLSSPSLIRKRIPVPEQSKQKFQSRYRLKTVK